MTMWQFIAEHPIYTFFLGVFLLVLVSAIGGAISAIRANKSC